jgi:hypothetical protein
LDNDEVEHAIPQYVKIPPQIKDMEEQAFAIEIVCQLRIETIIECNTLLMTLIHTKMRTTTSANVLQTST